MKVTWLGHSCFKIETENESIIIDPFQDGYVDGLQNIRENANLVLCSHEHGDHNAREVIKVTPKEIKSTITTLSTYHDDQKGAKRGLNTIHIIDDGKVKLAHFGDLGCELTQEEINVLKNVDVALIPIGGFFTIDSAQAKDIVNEITPRITIPMHYSSKDFGYPVLQTVDQFTQYFNKVTFLDTNTINVEDYSTDSILVLSI